MERKPIEVHPDVQSLVDARLLPEFDLDWIGRLPLDKQLSAAEKMVYGTPVDCPQMQQPERIRKLQLRDDYFNCE